MNSTDILEIWNDALPSICVWNCSVLTYLSGSINSYLTKFYNLRKLSCYINFRIFLVGTLLLPALVAPPPPPRQKNPHLYIRNFWIIFNFMKSDASCFLVYKAVYVSTNDVLESSTIIHALLSLFICLLWIEALPW